MLRIVAFDFAARTDREVPPDQLAGALQAGQYVWLDADLASAAETRRLLEAQAIGSLVLDEVFGTDIEGRYDVYENCIHAAVTEARFEGGRLATTYVDVLLAAGLILTYRRREADFLNQICRIYRDDFQKFSRSPGFLLYEIGDRLADGYRKTLRRFSASTEEVELALFGRAGDEIFRSVAELTGDLLKFRGIVLSSRELLHGLAARRSPFVSETTQPFLENLAGTMSRLGVDIATERETLTETLNLYMGMVGHRTNRVVNRLTVISMIFLPLTFLCGVYGMNFDCIPETRWPHGYLFFWIAAFGIAGVLTLIMWRRKWLS
jgi:magnesium transporter